jgi:hypothetical protein
MGRLDAILGRSPLDAPKRSQKATPDERVLWLDESQAPPQLDASRSIRVLIRVLVFARQTEIGSI